MSSIPSDCVARVGEALGEKLSKEQTRQIAEQLDTLRQQAERDGASPSQALHKAGRDYATKVQLAALIEKRNATINAPRFQALSTYLSTTWAGKEAEGMRAILTGSIEGRILGS